MKKKLLGSIALGLCLALGMTVPAMADSRKVVTLGADLTEDQKNTMMRYFGVDYNSVDVIYINNTQERQYLGSYVPLEQIGNYTYSCALVAPTTSGGIQVKAANLTFVTCNMIASTLSTSGVTNCQVVAAAPFKVSGTGALTGVILAYQQASQQTLSAEKVELANQELVTTGNLASDANVGQSKATAVINETKIQVIENNVTNIEEITNIVNNVSNEYNVEINEDQTAEIAELMQKIAEQDYDIQQLQATLDRVQANVAGDAGASEETVQALEEKADASAQAAEEAAQTDADDSDDDGDIVIIEDETDASTDETENILDNTDPDALSDGTTTVEEGDTTQTVQEQSEAAETETEEDLGIPEATGDTEETTDAAVEEVTEAATDAVVEEVTEAATDAAVEEVTEATTDAAVEEVTEAATEATTEEQLTADDLQPEDKTVYEEAKTDLDTDFASTTVTSEDGSSVWLTEDAAKALPEKVEQYLLEVMTKGADAVAMTEAGDPEINQNIVSDTSAQAPDKQYTDSELSQVDKYVRRLVFEDSENILADSQLEEADETVLYNTIMSALEKAYKVENTDALDAAADTLEGTVTDTVDTINDTVNEVTDTAEEYVDTAEDTLDEFADFDVEEGSY